MKQNNKDLSYDEAKDKIDKLMVDLENEELTIDELKAKIKEATTLIAYCKKSLLQTEEDIEEVLKDE